MINIAQRLARRCKASGKCLLWQGATTGRGYGYMRVGRAAEGMTLVHRVAYQMAYGEIPNGYEVHHRCRNKLCVNPKHLEVLPHGEHRIHHLLTVCRRGHPYTPENTYTYPNSAARTCKACRRERQWLKRHPK